VLLKEKPSQALDLHVPSNHGREVEVREEDDQQLRAADELGIDLSPAAVRAAAGELSAQEVEEGAVAVEEGGDVAIAADEALDGVEAVEVEADLDVDLADIELDD
jgi:DNA-directed RNA polymerase subunit beta